MAGRTPLWEFFRLNMPFPVPERQNGTFKEFSSSLCCGVIYAAIDSSGYTVFVLRATKIYIYI